MWSAVKVLYAPLSPKSVPTPSREMRPLISQSSPVGGSKSRARSSGNRSGFERGCTLTALRAGKSTTLGSLRLMYWSISGSFLDGSRWREDARRLRIDERTQALAEGVVFGLQRLAFAEDGCG